MEVDTGENNCFLADIQDRKMDPIKSQNEVFLYDEAEPLVYGCSETSLPPIVTSKKASLNISKRDSEKSQYFSVQSLPKIIKKTQNRADLQNKSGETVVDNFQHEIITKYNEFSNSTKSLVKMKTEYFNNSTDGYNTEDSLSSIKIGCARKDSKVKEIFSRTSPIFQTSSDSDFGHRGKHSDEFSTGVSDRSEARRNRDKTDRFKLDGKNSDVHWLTSKSIVKMIVEDPKIEGRSNTKRQMMNRMSSIQRKVSNKHMDFHPTPGLIVEEIKRNNLVIREDIFSSSKSQNNFAIEDSERVKVVDKTEKVEDEEQKTMGKTVGIEIFEAKGCSGRRENRSPENNVIVRQTEREKSPAVQRPQSQQTGKGILSNSNQIKCLTKSKTVEINQLHTMMNSIGINTEESTHSNSVQSAHPSNESRGSRVKTPTSGSSRYVKLPGYPEAFVSSDRQVQELRIKDGLSFESVNHLNKSKASKDSSKHEIAFEERKRAERIEREQPYMMFMVDEATGFESPMENRITQTSVDELDEKMTADTSVQCLIEAVNDDTNHHREIMICDDQGKGVQLYNILGHPVTDMSGYLLKDSHGRFLVRFDNFGVPTTCTDGKTIFLEDGSKWERFKEGFNIIHQKHKKNLINTPDESRKSQHRPKRKFEQETSSNSLRWLGDISTHSSTDTRNYLGKLALASSHNPLRNIKNNADSINTYNTSNLVAEMKSIARLRNALMERINLITDHRGPRLARRKESHSYKSMKRQDKPVETYWKSEPRLNSDKGRIQRNHKNKFNKTFKRKKDVDGEILFSNAASHFLRPTPRAPKRAQEDREALSGVNNFWDHEELALRSNSPWLLPPPSNVLSILRDEKLPEISERSVFEPWNQLLRAKSSLESSTQREQKSSALMPSIEGESDDNVF